MFENLSEEIYAQFAEWEQDQLDLAEAIEWGRREHKRAQSRRRAHESAVRLGKITGERKRAKAAKAAESMPLLARAALLPALAAPKPSAGLTTLAAPVVVRRKGGGTLAYRFAGGRALRCLLQARVPMAARATAPRQTGFAFLDPAAGGGR
jgi:hypothetical protein